MSDRAFKVLRHGEVYPTKIKEYTPFEDESVKYVFESPAGQQLLVEMLGNGNLRIGGWNREGEWIELSTIEPCVLATCRSPKHGRFFSLDQYTAAGEPEGPVIP